MESELSDQEDYTMDFESDSDFDSDGPDLKLDMDSDGAYDLHIDQPPLPHDVPKSDMQPISANDSETEASDADNANSNSENTDNKNADKNSGSTSSDAGAAIRLLGQGTFGCTYYPYIGCDGNIDVSVDYISKIQTKGTFDREFDIGKKVMQIPHHEWYYAPVISGCPVERADFMELTDASECQFLSKKSHAQDTIYSSKLKFVQGESLRDYVHHMVDHPVMAIDAKFQTMARLFHHLRTAVQQLQTVQLIHYDIKLDNVMYDLVRGIPIVIDFGLSFHVPDLTDNTAKLYLYTDEYYPFWPIESFLASNGAHGNIGGKPEWDHVVDTFIEQARKTLGDSLQKHPNVAQHEERINAFAQTHKDRYQESSSSIMADLQLETWDMYGLVMSFVRVMDPLYASESFSQWADQMITYLFSVPRPLEVPFF
jgi:hypothetical protein